MSAGIIDKRVLAYQQMFVAFVDKCVLVMFHTLLLLLHSQAIPGVHIVGEIFAYGMCHTLSHSGQYPHKL